MRITLLRHAQTCGNLRSAYIGRTDEPLASVGIETARAVPPRPGVCVVHTSALRRTMETAAILYPQAEIIPHARLNEMHFGGFEGKNFRDLEADPAYAAWLATDCEAPCPGGESKDAFTRRCREAFSAIVRENGDEEDLRFVVHGGTIMAIMSGCVTPERGYFDWRAGFCGGYVIENSGGGEHFALLETAAPPKNRDSA